MKNRKKHIIIFLAVYLFGAFQPVFPFLYYFVNYNFIVDNLCEQKDEAENLCLGTCYLNDEIAKKISEMQNEPEQKENHTNIQILSFHIGIQKQIDSKFIKKIIYTNHNTFLKTNFYTEPILPPPKQC